MQKTNKKTLSFVRFVWGLVDETIDVLDIHIVLFSDSDAFISDGLHHSDGVDGIDDENHQRFV